MAFDDSKYFAPAVKSEVGRVALRMSIALDSIERALKKICSGENNEIQDELDEIAKISADCSDMFDKLTGWTHDEEE